MKRIVERKWKWGRFYRKEFVVQKFIGLFGIGVWIVDSKNNLLARYDTLDKAQNFVRNQKTYKLIVG